MLTHPITPKLCTLEEMPKNPQDFLDEKKEDLIFGEIKKARLYGMWHPKVQRNIKWGRLPHVDIPPMF
jgi:hypothetical protein